MSFDMSSSTGSPLTAKQVDNSGLRWMRVETQSACGAAVPQRRRPTVLESDHKWTMKQGKKREKNTGEQASFWMRWGWRSP